LFEDLIGAELVPDEEMLIVRDPVSGDWHVEDYAGEAVLFHMPQDCSLDEIRRAPLIERLAAWPIHKQRQWLESAARPRLARASANR
jgi:hypothetical protein